MIKRNDIKKAITALAVSGVIVLGIIAGAAGLTEQSKISEKSMTTVTCAAMLVASFAGSIIYNNRRREGRIIRGLAIGIIYFAIVFIAGKSTGFESAETGYTIALLIATLTGAIVGAVISNKKQRYKR